VHLEGVG
jgi:4a-hydroxytetrahydrobiopterin dehydratase